MADNPNKESDARRRRRRAEARRRREREIRIRKTIAVVLIAIAFIAIGVMAFRIHRRNKAEEEAALAASRAIAEEQAAAEASRKAAEEEAALEASRKAAEEEAALEASRKAAEEEAALQASREKAEEEGALAASRRAAEEQKEKAEAAKIPGLNASYDFTADENTENVPDDIDSAYAVIMDLKTGKIIAGREYDTIMNPASMTKILTLLVAVENINLSRLDTEIHQGITDYVFTNQMSQVGFGIGDTPTIRSLLYGTILPSGADAALALAEYTAGSEEMFVKMMNKKLEELGISDTAHFTNVVGAYDEDHYCTALDMATILRATALDMATILRAAIDNELCREVLSCHYYEVPPSGGEDSESIGISNWFLRRIEDKDTHGEVISYQVSDDGGHYICVTADAPDTWSCIYDHVELYETYTN